MKLNLTVNELNREIENLNLKSERTESDYKKKLNEIIKESDCNVKSFNVRLAEAEGKFRETDKNYKEMQIIWKRDEALLTQKLEFALQQAEEAVSQLEDNKLHRNSITDIISDSSSTENIDIILQNLSSQFQDDLRKKGQEHMKNKKTLENHIENLITEKNDIELKYKLDLNEWNTQKYEMTEEIEHLTLDINRLKENSESLVNSNLYKISEIEAKYNLKLKALIGTLEDTKQKCSEEIANVNSEKENTYIQLKDFFESEKSRLDKKLADEKERFEAKMTEICKDYEEKIKEQREEFEGEIQHRDEEISEYEMYMTDELTQHKHRLGLSEQKSQNLEKHLKETKENLENLQKSHTRLTEQIHDIHAKERINLTERIDKLAENLSIKEKENSNLEFKYEQLENSIRLKESELEEINKKYNEEKETWSLKLENFKQSITKTNDDFTAKKNDYKREIALARQDLEFKSKRLEELEKNLQISEDKYRDTFKN